MLRELVTGVDVRRLKTAHHRPFVSLDCLTQENIPPDCIAERAIDVYC